MKNKEEYISKYSIDGRCSVEVEGKNIVDVVGAAEKAFSDSHFGEITVVSHKIFCIRDENDKAVYVRGQGSINDVKLNGGKYRVCFCVKGLFFPVMHVFDVISARHLGEHRLFEADFGDMDFVDGNLINIKFGDAVVYVA